MPIGVDNYQRQNKQHIIENLIQNFYETVIGDMVMIFMERNYIFVMCARLAKSYYNLYIFVPLIDYS